MATATLLRLFDQHWAGWRRGVEACRDGLSRPAVHQLRVDSRRLLSLLDLVREVVPVPAGADQRATRAVETLLDALGPLRDAQNQRNRVKRTRPGEGVDSLRRHLKRREARLAKRARRALEDVDGAKVEKAIARLRAEVATPGAAGAPAERPLRLARAVDLVAADARNRLAEFDLDRPRTAHRLRIALKRFRYAMEIAVRISPEIDAGGQATVRALQRRLGRAHDADVLLERLDRFARRHPDSTGAGVDALRRAIGNGRDRQLKGLTGALLPLRRALTAVASQAAARPRGAQTKKSEPGHRFGATGQANSSA